MISAMPRLPRYMEKMMAEMVHGIVDVMHSDLPKASLHQAPPGLGGEIAASQA